MNALTKFDRQASALDDPEYQYLNLLEEILTTGTERPDRTGVGTKGLFGRQIRFDLQAGYPILTTKKVHFKSVALELLWFLRGDTNVRWLRERGVRIWNEWADDNGNLGPIYGKQWRSWATPKGDTIDQISNVLEGLRTNPNGRRHIVSAWNPADIDDMALPPCHCLFRFFVADGKLSCQLYQRSADIFLGVPFNIASYALLTMMMAKATDLEPGEFIHTFGDVHLYLNHVDQAREQLQRKPKGFPKLLIKNKIDILDFNLEDFELKDYLDLDGYGPHGPIKASVAV